LNPPDGLEVHRRDGAEVAVFTFGSYVNRSETAPSYAFMKTSRSVQAQSSTVFDTWYLLSNANDWYIGGVKHLADSFAAAAPLVAELARPYRRTVFVGNSMGGYGAMAFGAHANASKVIAISPQSRFDADFHARIGETRWGSAMNAMRAKHDVEPFALATLFENAPHNPAIDLLCGADCPQDTAYADELAGFSNVAINKVPGTDHDLAHKLRERGSLEKMLLAAIS
jgi:pimeloyl-ACP methyl ester carboxylesterase